MEISYYFECLNVNGTFYPECSSSNSRTAEFRFEMKFSQNYTDLNSDESKKLWHDIEPIMKKSFGSTAIELTIKEIKNGSVVLEVEITPLRKNSVDEMNWLLNNNITACQNILDSKINDDISDCWAEHTKEIFIANNFTFLGVSIKPIITANATRITTDSTTTTIANSTRVTTSSTSTKVSTITTASTIATTSTTTTTANIITASNSTTTVSSKTVLKMSSSIAETTAKTADTITTTADTTTTTADTTTATAKTSSTIADIFTTTADHPQLQLRHLQ